MCNIMAAVAGVGLLMMMGGRNKSQQPAPPPTAPMPTTKYAGSAQDQANANQGLPNDGAGSPATSSQIVAGNNKSPGGGGYRNPIAIPRPSPPPGAGLPTIGSLGRQKPVNY